MGIILSYSKKEKAKVKAMGSTLGLLALLVSISKYLTERISTEKGVCLEEAENIVVDCIKDGMKVINKRCQ